MIKKLLNKFLDSNEKEIDRLRLIVDQINFQEKSTEKLSDKNLSEKTAEFKLRFERGESLDQLLIEAFSNVREAAKRTINERHYDVQLIAGIVLHQGKIAEQKTGEGKTLSASTALYLNSLTGKGCHLVTVNDYLARIGCGWMGPVYHLLGVTCGVVMQDAAFIYDPNYEDNSQSDWRLKFLRPVTKKEAYQADITYGTNNEYGFDYLRDNMVWSLDQMAQRGQHYAIVDEVDSILIDEARTPLIISAPAQEATEKYYLFAKLIDDLNPETDYLIDEKLKTANLTEHAILKIEKRLGVVNLYEKEFATIHHIEQGLRARTLFQKDRDYVIKDNQIVIVDEFTGRLMPGRRWSEGLHQAIEAKEGVSIQQESKTLATISFQNYFRLYQKLSGMTGTAATEAEEFHKIYQLDVVIIPTNKLMVRRDLSDAIYKNTKAKFTAVANEVLERHKKGQPVLIGTTSIEKNDLMSKLLTHMGVSYQALNAKNHQQEAEIIAQAGSKNTVTLATNIAGRGVDIILGGKPPNQYIIRDKHEFEEEHKKWQKSHDEIVNLGGLFVIGTERHESRRIDNQLRGRTGRQGDPGESKFYVSLEDDIMRLFGGEQVAKIMTLLKLPEDTPIEHPMVSKAIENAQVKVEGHNFDIRKHVVEYDDVANKQRDIIYSYRQKILSESEQQNDNFDNEILEKINNEIENLVNYHLSEDQDDIGITELIKDFSNIIPFDDNSKKQLENSLMQSKNPQQALGFIKDLSNKIYQDRTKKLGKDVIREINKFVILNVTDTLWMEHLDTLDDLRQGIGLRGYAQRDPLVEYKAEAFSLFEKLLASIDYEIVHRIFKIQPQAAAEPTQSTTTTSTDNTQLIVNKPLANIDNINRSTSDKKIGRNDPCPCGSIDPDSGKPYKYKKCGLINAPYHKG